MKFRILGIAAMSVLFGCVEVNSTDGVSNKGGDDGFDSNESSRIVASESSCSLLLSAAEVPGVPRLTTLASAVENLNPSCKVNLSIQIIASENYNESTNQPAEDAPLLDLDILSQAGVENVTVTSSKLLLKNGLDVKSVKVIAKHVVVPKDEFISAELDLGETELAHVTGGNFAKLPKQLIFWDVGILSISNAEGRYENSEIIIPNGRNLTFWAGRATFGEGEVYESGCFLYNLKIIGVASIGCKSNGKDHLLFVLDSVRTRSQQEIHTASSYLLHGNEYGFTSYRLELRNSILEHVLGPRSPSRNFMGELICRNSHLGETDYTRGNVMNGINTPPLPDEYLPTFRSIVGCTIR